MSVGKAYIGRYQNRPHIGITNTRIQQKPVGTMPHGFAREPTARRTKTMAYHFNRAPAEKESHIDMSTADEAGSMEEDARRIGDLAKEYGVSLRTLRFYEDKGLLTPERVGSTRLYHRRDVSRLELILLGRKVGFSLREVKQLMDLYDPNGTNIRQLKAVVDRSTRQLGRLEKQRAELDSAIQAISDLISTTKDKLASIPTGKPN